MPFSLDIIQTFRSEKAFSVCGFNPLVYYLLMYMCIFTKQRHLNRLCADKCTDSKFMLTTCSGWLVVERMCIQTHCM